MRHRVPCIWAPRDRGWEEINKNCLPELVSGGEDSSEDSGYDFLNMPTNDEEKDFEAAAEIKEETRGTEEEKSKENKDTYSENEEEQLEESINFILNMEDPNYKAPEPCIGLTCPPTGEQYYVD